MQDAQHIIDAMNTALARKRMFQKELYEHLIAQRVIEPNTEKEFKNLLDWAGNNHHLDNTRIRTWRKKRGKLPRYFTKAQLTKLFDAIDRPKDSVACVLALMCGLRINEVCHLRVTDLDCEHHRVFIRDSKNPHRTRDHYGTDRYVDFDPALDSVLKKWLDLIGTTSEWLFPSDKSPDTHLTKKSLHNRFRDCLKAAGLLEVEYTYTITTRNYGKRKAVTVSRHRYYFHCLRHTIASIIYNKTGDIYAVSRFLGHKQLDTTTIYARITDQKMRQTISSVFRSLHYHTHNGEHLPLPTTPQPQQPIPPATGLTPLQLLETQYINGDLTEQEFLRKKTILQTDTIKQIIKVEEASRHQIMDSRGAS